MGVDRKLGTDVINVYIDTGAMHKVVTELDLRGC